MKSFRIIFALFALPVNTAFPKFFQLSFSTSFSSCSLPGPVLFELITRHQLSAFLQNPQLLLLSFFWVAWRDNLIRSSVQHQIKKTVIFPYILLTKLVIQSTELSQDQYRINTSWLRLDTYELIIKSYINNIRLPNLYYQVYITNASDLISFSHTCQHVSVISV